MFSPTDTHLSDTQLIALIKSDPDAGLAILMDTRIRTALAYLKASRRCTDEQRLDEIRADLLVHAWRHAEQYDPHKGTLVTWLYAIAQNIVTWAPCGKRPEHIPLGHKANSVVHQTQKPSFGSKKKRNALREAISSLPARQSKLAKLDLESSAGHANTREAMQTIGASTPNAVYGVRKRYMRNLADPRRHRKLHSVITRLGRTSAN